MLLTEHFVFVHFLKTGGTFVKQALLSSAPQCWHCVDLEGHPSISDIPRTYAAKPRFGFVRNPWDWYVSVYQYFHHLADDPLFFEISQSRTLCFADTIRRSFDLQPFADSGVGPLTYFFRRTFEDDDHCSYLRFESLRSDLLGFLRELPLALPPAVEDAILRGPAVNASPRGHYRQYYDSALRREIAERDAELIRRFGYDF